MGLHEKVVQYAYMAGICGHVYGTMLQESEEKVGNHQSVETSGDRAAMFLAG